MFKLFNNSGHYKSSAQQGRRCPQAPGPAPLRHPGCGPGQQRPRCRAHLHLEKGLGALDTDQFFILFFIASFPMTIYCPETPCHLHPPPPHCSPVCCAHDETRPPGGASSPKFAHCLLGRPPLPLTTLSGCCLHLPLPTPASFMPRVCATLSSACPSCSGLSLPASSLAKEFEACGCEVCILSEIPEENLG